MRRETRYQLFTLRPTQRASWIGFAMAYHLMQDYDMALQVLEEFRKTQNEYDYEHSEFLLYENMVYYEAGKYQEAFDHLEAHRPQIFDYVSYLETKGILLRKLDRKQQAADVYRLLIEQNPENEAYYRSLEICMIFCSLIDPSSHSAAERRLALYDEMMLTFCREKFIDRIEPILIRMLRKGVAPLFTMLKFLYSDREKVVNKLSLTFPFVSESVKEPPSTLLWVYYFLALHYDHLGDSSKALTFINKSIDHTPTLIELYMAKGRIFKHAGNRFEAVHWMEEAQSLDTADRYINSKCAKYMLMAGMVNEAEAMCSKFTRVLIIVVATRFLHLFYLCLRNSLMYSFCSRSSLIVNMNMTIHARIPFECSPVNLPARRSCCPFGHSIPRSSQLTVHLLLRLLDLEQLRSGATGC
ncbi:unnamed protein product [Soboliphyme baturini]|uniref:TPR_REGION domain-containing protein n=1 Tax=Soboliphyme baturini TaxID=241478 RepID=A0A183J7V6_9BILA|nr:unnamed protein product [Soboliphyme baturini]